MEQVPAKAGDAPVPLGIGQTANLVRELQTAAPDGALGAIESAAASLDGSQVASQNFVDALSCARVGVVHRSIDGRIIAVNDFFCELVGITRADRHTIDIFDFCHPDEKADLIATYKAHLRDALPFQFERRYVRADGTEHWCLVHVSFISDECGRPTSSIAVVLDDSTRRKAVAELQESEERFRLAARAAGLGIWDFDAVQGRREWSEDFKRMLGLPLDAEPDIPTALALVVPEDRHLLQNLIHAVYANLSEHRFEVLLRIRRADDNAERWMQTSGWRIEAANGRLERVLVTIRDVTEQRDADERVRWTANHDALTKLANRGYFNQRLDAAIAQAQAATKPLALVIFDIDNFKEANDTIGHDAGDLLLRTFAARLQASLGDHGFVARLGGDEFAAFVEVADEQDLARLVLPALQHGSATAESEDVSLPCDATAGAALFPRDGTTAKELLKTADIALYSGKAAQRGTLTVFQPHMREHVQRRSAMLATARHVIAEERVVPFYQPKVSLDDGRIAGFEALLRWRDGAHAIQGPEHLSAAFEDLNLASSLGTRMLEGVCRDMARWREAGLDFGRVALNLSPAEFRRDDLFDRIMETLHRHDLPPSTFEMEVTETVFLGRGAETVGDVLERFHHAGISLALDDFGTGYASLTHLQAFPVNVIKIDRSFVTNLAAGSANAAIVDAIIGLAGRLGMEVIAEGIEAHGEAQYLRARGCAYGQGFLFSQAVDGLAVERMLAKGPMFSRQCSSAF